MSEPSPERRLHGSVARTPVRGRREVGLVAGATTDVNYFRLAPESQIPPVCYFRQLRNRLYQAPSPRTVRPTRRAIDATGKHFSHARRTLRLPRVGNGSARARVLSSICRSQLSQPLTPTWHPSISHARAHLGQGCERCCDFRATSRRLTLARTTPMPRTPREYYLVS